MSGLRHGLCDSPCYFLYSNVAATLSSLALHGGWVSCSAASVLGIFWSLYKAFSMPFHGLPLSTCSKLVLYRLVCIPASLGEEEYAWLFLLLLQYFANLTLCLWDAFGIVHSRVAHLWHLLCNSHSSVKRDAFAQVSAATIFFSLPSTAWEIFIF